LGGEGTRKVEREKEPSRARNGGLFSGNIKGDLPSGGKKVHETVQSMWGEICRTRGENRRCLEYGVMRRGKEKEEDKRGSGFFRTIVRGGELQKTTLSYH